MTYLAADLLLRFFKDKYAQCLTLGVGICVIVPYTVSPSVVSLAAGHDTREFGFKRLGYAAAARYRHVGGAEKASVPLRSSQSFLITRLRRRQCRKYKPK